MVGDIVCDVLGAGVGDTLNVGDDVGDLVGDSVGNFVGNIVGDNWAGSLLMTPLLRLLDVLL